MGASHGTIPENTTTNTMITTTTTTGGAVKHPEPFQMVFPTGYRFLSSYHFPKRWLHTLIKEFILCFLCEMSAYNHQIYMFFDKISFLQSWNDAMACARHTVSLQGPTWNLKVTCSECEFAACEAFSWTAAFRAPHLRSSLWRYHHSDVSNHGRVNGEQST